MQPSKYYKPRRYEYYDVTPDGENNEENCVTRAITLATRLPYRTVQKLLKLNGKANHCDCLTENCYSKLLEDVFGYKRYDCDFEYTVEEITDMYYDHIVLMRVPHHLTISVYGESFDIFDTTQALVDCFWLVK